MAKFTIIRQKQGSLCFKVRNVFFQDSVFRFKYKAIMLHSESLARHRREYNVFYWGIICIQLHFALSGECNSSYICNRIKVSL